jgi:hypothetical protein
MLRLTKRTKETTQPPKKGQALVLPLNATGNSLFYLTSIIKTIRPSSIKDTEQANVKFKALLYQLSQDKSSLFSLRKALLSQFLRTNI